MARELEKLGGVHYEKNELLVSKKVIADYIRLILTVSSKK